MKLLLVADHEESRLWDYYQASKTEGVDLILSCGDLDPAYLEFLTTMVNRPLLYVRGNHDDKYEMRPPEGCIPIEDMVYDYQGLRILGLGGSYRYGNRTNMYTEAEMDKRIRKLRNTLKITGGFDILLTHAPALGYGDLEDIPHRGFDCFNDLMETYHPMYMFHGHVHKEYGPFHRTLQHSSGTQIVNAYGSWMIEIPDDQFGQREESFLYRMYKRRHSY